MPSIDDSIVTQTEDGMQVFSFELKRNIMGGTNVLVNLNGARFHVASYCNRSAARRAIRSRAVVRRALRVEGEPAMSEAEFYGWSRWGES